MENKKQCYRCKQVFDESEMHKTQYYYNISKKAEQSRKTGFTLVEFGSGILELFDHFDYKSEEERAAAKAAARYDLEHNYELRERVTGLCEGCATSR
jgi:hypothetical protein